MSAFVVAYRIPNYLRRIFAEGSFSSAFVPVLSELKQRGDQKALQDFLDHVAGALLAIVIVVSGLGMLAAPWIAELFLLFAAPGWTAWLLRIVAGLLAMTAAVLAVRAYVGDWTALSMLWRWVWLLAAVSAGAAAYGVVLVALGLRPRHLRH